MDIKQIDERVSVTGQIQPGEVAALARQGFRSIVCNRPDYEEPGQPEWAAIAAAAEAAGIAHRHIPVGAGITPEDQAEAFASALAELPGPMLAFCRTGNRSGLTYQAALACPGGR